MSAGFERFLNRLLLITITAAAVVMAKRYDGAAQLSLYFLAAVAMGGLLAPIPTSREPLESDRDL